MRCPALSVGLPALPVCLATLLAMLAGCGAAQGATAGDGTVVGARRTTVTVRAAEPARSDALDVRLEGLATLLRRAGAAANDTATRGFLAGGESATVAVTVPAGSCATVTTIASPGVRDLDATLFAPSGEVLAEDVADDAHPTVQLCAPGTAARRAYVVVRAYSGAGAYVLATFPSPREALAPVAAVIGGAPGIASDTIHGVADDARLRDHALGASRRGFAARGEPRVVPLAAAQSVWVPLAVGAAECISVIALAERGLEDIDAQLLDSDGAELVRDVGTGRDASVQHCAESAGELVLVLSAVRGQGTARVAVFAGPVTRVGGASGLWLGQPAADRATSRPLDAGTGEARARAMAARFVPRGQPLRTALARGGAWRTSTHVEPGSCVRFEVSAGPGLARPYLLLSADGVALGEHQGRGEGQPAIAHLCARTALGVDAVVVARSGAGDVALSVSVRATELPSDAAARAEALRLDERARAIAAGGDVSAPQIAAPSARARLDVPVAAGTCVRVVFVADDAARVQIEAVRAAHLVARDTADAPRVGLCAELGAASSLEVSAVSASGGELRGTWLVSRKRVR